MIQILEGTRADVASTKAMGKLTKEDYDQLLPFLEQKLADHKKIRWYFEMENFEGWEPQAAWEDAKFDIKNATNLEKVSMVGGKQWEEALTKLMKPFTTAEVKYFTTAEKQEAIKWIES
jgi:hypothetical protein